MALSFSLKVFLERSDQKGHGQKMHIAYRGQKWIFKHRVFLAEAANMAIKYAMFAVVYICCRGRAVAYVVRTCSPTPLLKRQLNMFKLKVKVEKSKIYMKKLG